MNWQESRAACRARYVAKYDEAESKAYDGYVGTLSDEDEIAYLTDMTRVFRFRARHVCARRRSWDRFVEQSLNSCTRRKSDRYGAFTSDAEPVSREARAIASGVGRRRLR